MRDGMRSSLRQQTRSRMRRLRSQSAARRGIRARMAAERPASLTAWGSDIRVRYCVAFLSAVIRRYAHWDDILFAPEDRCDTLVADGLRGRRRRQVAKAIETRFSLPPGCLSDIGDLTFGQLVSRVLDCIPERHGPERGVPLYWPDEWLREWKEAGRTSRFFRGAPSRKLVSGTLQALTEQMRARTCWDLSLWGDDRHVWYTFSFVSSVVREHLSWDDILFIPDDPCEIDFWEPAALVTDFAAEEAMTVITRHFRFPQERLFDVGGLTYGELIARLASAIRDGYHSSASNPAPTGG